VPYYMGESKQRYIKNENWSERKMWISGTNFVSKKDIIIVKTKYPISCKPSGRYFEKSKLPPCNTAHIITSHVIRIRLLHLLEIWLVTFRIYDICKIKHILRDRVFSFHNYNVFFGNKICSRNSHFSLRSVFVFNVSLLTFVVCYCKNG
jgi:hypothetical protein